MICSVAGCEKEAKNSGMCWKHYTRKRRYGDVNALKKLPSGYWRGQRCSVEGCNNFVRTKGFCNMHYLRKWKGQVAGPATPYIADDGAGYISVHGYHIITVPGRGQIKAHRYIAEKALGKRLPNRAVVHHWNRNRLDNRNCNLVVCPDESYHRLLHARQKALGYDGPPPPESLTNSADAEPMQPVAAISTSEGE